MFKNIYFGLKSIMDDNQLAECNIKKTGIWEFLSLPDKNRWIHIVEIGWSINCNCNNNLNCKFLQSIIMKIWRISNCLLTMNYLRNTNITCFICQKETHLINKGIDFTFCRQCLQVVCVQCIFSSGTNSCYVCRRLNAYPILFFNNSLDIKELTVDFNNLDLI